MYFPVISTIWIWKFSTTMVVYTGFRRCILWNWFWRTRVVIDKMFVYHFADPDLRIETFFEKNGAVENGEVDLEIGDLSSPVHLYWRMKEISFRVCLLSYCLFGDQTKTTFKSSHDLFFYPSIIESRIEEKVHIKARGGSIDFKKGGSGVPYVSHHVWPTKKILGFTCSKKAKILLETKAFGETFLSVFSNFLHFYI